MSEHFHTRDESLDDDHQIFLNEARRIDTEVRQIFFDVIQEVAGDEAVEFARNMQIDFDISNDIMPTLELLLDTEQLFPGSVVTIIERWKPVFIEYKELCDNEFKRIEAKMDLLTLQPYEDAQDIADQGLSS